MLGLSMGGRRRLALLQIGCHDCYDCMSFLNINDSHVRLALIGICCVVLLLSVLVASPLFAFVRARVREVSFYQGYLSVRIVFSTED